MKKILVLTLEYPPQVGGIATYTQNFVASLSPQEVVVYAPLVKGCEAYDQAHPQRIYRKKPLFWLIWPRWLKMYFQVRKLVKTENITEIYVHHALPAGYVAYLIKKTLKVPFVLFFHGTDLELALKHKVKKISLICASARKVVLSSEFLKEKLLSKINVENAVVVHPGVDEIFLSQVDEQKINKLKAELSLQGKKVMLSVGRIAEGKGFLRLAKLIPKILSQIPNLVWLVVGEGVKQEELVSQVQKLGLQNSVRFIGAVSHDNLPIYYQSADLFTLLTHRDKETEEGWGMVFLEARASGLPVVAGRVGGVVETIIDGETGRLVDVSDEGGVVGAICEMLLNEEQAKHMGEVGKEKVEANFRWKKSVEKILLSSRPNPPAGGEGSS